MSYNSWVLAGLVISNRPCATYTCSADLKLQARLLPELYCTSLSPIAITNCRNKLLGQNPYSLPRRDKTILFVVVLIPNLELIQPIKITVIANGNITL